MSIVNYYVYCFLQNTKVGEVLRALGTNPTEAEVHRLCQDYMKKDDRISFDTFLPILQSKCGHLFSCNLGTGGGLQLLLGWYQGLAKLPQL